MYVYMDMDGIYVKKAEAGLWKGKWESKKKKDREEKRRMGSQNRHGLFSYTENLELSICVYITQSKEPQKIC